MLTTAYSAAWQDVVDETDSAEEEKESLTQDAAPMSDSIDKAAWFSPGRLLLLFSSINMMIYIDRGAPLHAALTLVQSVNLTRTHVTALCEIHMCGVLIEQGCVCRRDFL